MYAVWIWNCLKKYTIKSREKCREKSQVVELTLIVASLLE